MVSINNTMYKVISRDKKKFFIRNDMLYAIDEDKDTDDILMQMSDFILEVKKNKGGIDEWLMNRGGNNEL